jgi:hypothetical protein
MARQKGSLRGSAGSLALLMMIFGNSVKSLHNYALQKNEISTKA